MAKKNEQSNKIRNNENEIPIVADIKMHTQEKPISDVYSVIDNDLARDNLENDITAADLQDL